MFCKDYLFRQGKKAGRGGGNENKKQLAIQLALADLKYGPPCLFLFCFVSLTYLGAPVCEKKYTLGDFSRARPQTSVGTVLSALAVLQPCRRDWNQSGLFAFQHPAFVSRPSRGSPRLKAGEAVRSF